MITPSTIELPRPRRRPQAKNRAPLDHATQLILRVCHLAGAASFVADARESLEAEGVHAAVRTRNTAALFDWLVSILSYQGISAKSPSTTWSAMAWRLGRRLSAILAAHRVVR